MSHVMRDRRNATRHGNSVAPESRASRLAVPTQLQPSDRPLRSSVDAVATSRARFRFANRSAHEENGPGGSRQIPASFASTGSGAKWFLRIRIEASCFLAP